ncbi:LCP family protein [Aquibacillus saliphilus]|uniref:LCP family protein n=1 Tax=Aquibacillus saliphilus TaxID=1909422 RepID=UPI001CF0821B|nr:LCP family protein [Aquibacillus saliphilus]
MDRHELKTNKKKKHFIGTLKIVLLLLAIGILGTVSYLFYQGYAATEDSYDDLGREKSDLRKKAVSIAKDPISVLLLGIEDYSATASNGRADAIIVVTFNQSNETMKMLSIPRDTLVPIAGMDKKDKINHSYVFGGPAMTINTVEKFLNIPIDYYTTVNFEGFKNVVDIIGGINVNVPFDFSEDSDVDNGKLYYTKGDMQLDGEQALGFARMRMQDPEGDIGRGERQKEIIKAIISKLASPTTVFKFDDLAEEYGNTIVSNMKLKELLNFYQEYGSFDTSTIEELTIEGRPAMINGVSYITTEQSSVNAVSRTLREHLNLSENST